MVYGIGLTTLPTGKNHQFITLQLYHPLGTPAASYSKPFPYRSLHPGADTMEELMGLRTNRIKTTNTFFRSKRI